ncbi:hypothetical protein BC834DRAFT_121675 [Gloeopeniophorella convolvens]|nr:hypothetical protein BC834DRAFT_121675 [Gloeopeniophorella convolvens]
MSPPAREPEHCDLTLESASDCAPEALGTGTLVVETGTIEDAQPLMEDAPGGEPSRGLETGDPSSKEAADIEHTNNACEAHGTSHPGEPAGGGDSASGGEPTRTRRKRKGLDLAMVRHCICGDEAVAGAKDSIMCAWGGCDTIWFHLECVELVEPAKGWTCTSCKATASKKQRRR